MFLDEVDRPLSRGSYVRFSRVRRQDAYPDLDHFRIKGVSGAEHASGERNCSCDNDSRKRQRRSPICALDRNYGRRRRRCRDLLSGPNLVDGRHAQTLSARVLQLTRNLRRLLPGSLYVAALLALRRRNTQSLICAAKAQSLKNLTRGWPRGVPSNDAEQFLTNKIYITFTF